MGNPLVISHPKNVALRPRYLSTDWTKKLKFDWWVVIDVDYIIVKYFFNLVNFYTAQKRLKLGRQLPSVNKNIKGEVNVDIGDTLGLCVVGINVSEAFVLGFEDEVNSENDSIVSKHEKNKSGVVFVGSVGIMGLVYILVMD